MRLQASKKIIGVGKGNYTCLEGEEDLTFSELVRPAVHALRDKGAPTLLPPPPSRPAARLIARPPPRRTTRGPSLSTRTRHLAASPRCPHPFRRFPSCISASWLLLLPPLPPSALLQPPPAPHASMFLFFIPFLACTWQAGASPLSASRPSPAAGWCPPLFLVSWDILRRVRCPCARRVLRGVMHFFSAQPPDL